MTDWICQDNIKWDDKNTTHVLSEQEVGVEYA